VNQKGTVLPALVLMGFLGGLPLAAEDHPAKKDPAGFERIKSLAGDWVGKTSEGKTVLASYKVVSAGSAVLETLNAPGEMDMVSVYHADGDSILMTHYCAANNQPRMRARVTSPDPKEIVFSFVDAANLSTPREGHMTGLTLTFKDPDHISQTWTWSGEGGEKPEVFEFQRKK
jgi:hypothetical protein